MFGFSETVPAIRAAIPQFFPPSVRRSLALAGWWLVIVNIFALLAFNRLNLEPDNAFIWLYSILKPAEQSWDLITLHSRWDSSWYLDIAQNGYHLRGETIANVVFFPLYPLLIRWTAPLLGGNLVLTGWMLSCLFLFLAVIFLTRLTKEFHRDIDPSLPTVFLLAHPAAFFLNAVYSESLFLFLSLAAVFFARRRQFLLASICVGFASATRIAGLFLVVVLLIEFVQANGWQALLSHRVLPLALAPLGLLAFLTYHWAEFGDFFLYLKIQTHFGRDFSFDFSNNTFINPAHLANTIIDFTHTALAVILGIITLLRLRFSYGAYMLFSLGIALSTGSTLAIPRYSMVLFPIYFIGAGLRSPVHRAAWLFASTLFLALDIIRFVNHYWVS